MDLHRFRRLVRQAGTDSPFQRALELSDGELFAGLGTPWLAHVRTLVETDRVAAVTRHADQLLSQGRYSELIPMLVAETDAHPLHEWLTGQLMLALFGVGQETEALRVYHRLRVQLRDELGIVPSARSRTSTSISSACPPAGEIHALKRCGVRPVRRQAPAGMCRWDFSACDQPPGRC